MSPAARSVILFGWYVLILGLGLMCVPALLLTPFGFEPPHEVWVRVLGSLVTAVGAYYVALGKAEDRAFFQVTVLGRVWIFVTLAVFVLLDLARPALVLFGTVDLIGAIWTLRALAREPEPAPLR